MMVSSWNNSRVTQRRHKERFSFQIIRFENSQEKLKLATIRIVNCIAIQPRGLDKVLNGRVFKSIAPEQIFCSGDGLLVLFCLPLGHR